MLLRNVVHSPDLLNESKILEDFDELDRIFNRCETESEHCSFLTEEPPSLLQVTSELKQMIASAQESIKIIQPYV